MQNVMATVWAWSIPESQLRIWFDSNMYDMLLLFHILQFVALCVFFWASCTEPGFLPSKHSEAASADAADHEKVSLLSDRDDPDVESGNITKIDIRKEVPPSYCRKYVLSLSLCPYFREYVLCSLESMECTPFNAHCAGILCPYPCTLSMPHISDFA